jgi:regulator of protease activity HflC (stomatin/prohibitin superfamily)
MSTRINSEKMMEKFGVVGRWLKRILSRLKAKLTDNLPQVIVASLILAFIIVYFWHSIFITIKSGEAGVLYLRFFGGTVTDKVYGEGFHIIAPWNTMTIYNVRYQANPHEMDALTQTGLRVHLNLNIRYHPEYNVLGVLHQTVGPDYLNKIVIPEVEAVLRKIVGQFDAEEVYTTKRAIVEKIVNEALEQVSQRFIQIDDVMVTRLELPERIKQAIEAKLEQQQLAEAYRYRLDRERKEAERKRIEATGYRDYNAILESSITEKILKWKGVEATLELSKSQNSKVIIIGGGKDGLPIILDTK